MTREDQMRVVLSAFFALAGTSLLWHFGTLPGPHWYDFLYTPGLVTGVIVSRNAHQPNMFIMHTTNFMVAFIVIYGLVASVGFVLSRPKDKTDPKRGR